ncbi:MULTISPECIES: hypothetical protein [Streptomyces]|nr:hypothetical protein [Streptomyces canus]
MLPLEAIEVDAFRRIHEHDTFWCGLLLGGCGGQLTTKLYTDRACHFAHHPDPDGRPHACRRRARGVNSADHLYVKSAAAAWLRDRGEQARFDFTQPDGAPVGSVVDIRFKNRGLRVHLDETVPPVWDGEYEPVLAVSVPVDGATLAHRWYVHRIRLDSEGTTRQVRIGTEAFAREIEWYGLGQCEVTERGLSTPAVERIVQSRTTPPPTRWSPSRPRKGPDADARARGLMRRLADALKVDSVIMVRRVCREIAELTGVSEEVHRELATAVEEAQRWLDEQAEARHDLFARLDQAATEEDAKQVRDLLILVNATAAADRTEAEDAIVEKATEFFAGLAHAAHEQIEAEAAAERAAGEAAARVRSTLKSLRRHDAYTYDLRPQVEILLRSAAASGDRLTARQAAEVDVWKKRAADGVPPRPLYKQVARRYWIQRSCPRCQAGKGKDCVFAEGTNAGTVREFPHDERLQPIVDERKAREKAIPRPWRVYDITCPDCGRGYNAPCKSPSGPHRSRVELAKEYTRLRKPPPKR